MDCKCLDTVIEKLPPDISAAVERCKSGIADRMTELSLRAGRPVCVYFGSKLLFMTKRGCLTDSPAAGDLLTVGIKDIESTVLRLCNHSVYAFQEQINSGFITAEGGVRVGLCGRAVIRSGELVNIRDISSLNFRIPREVKGCSRELLSLVEPLRGVLICGEPSSGKTTLIRDIARQLSYRYRVSVLDERLEISASRLGENGFDVGLCDVFAGYPKGASAISAIRSMAPEILVCDELGDKADVGMLSEALRCGVAVVAAVHASSMDDLRSRETASALISTSAFSYIVFLKGRREAGRIDKIYGLSGSA